LLRAAGVERVDGLLFDLGVSSMQLDEAERGFSFRADGPLDMRMDRTAPASAAELLASITEKELGRLLRLRGEERRAAAIARAIVRERERTPLTRTRQLAEIIERVAGPAARAERIHPATRTFQALRIAVNAEIEGLAGLIEEAAALLVPGGRLAIIAYHSLEDRVVKQTFRALASRCECPPRLPVCGCGKQDVLKVLTPRAVRPADDEIAANPRARSARLRVAERL
jgi:16S rRNA (cytosine1402-N4)-methyltransferase